jgi:hypothetical protein
MLFVSANLFSQDSSFLKKGVKPKVEFGVMRVYNSLNDDNYFNFIRIGSVNNGDMGIAGFNFKLQLETKYDWMDINVGTLMISDLHENVSGWNPGNTNSSQYILNGGGVYCGISPKIKGRFIGLTSDFGIGVFSFKEYMSIFNNIVEPYVDEHNLKASYGLGAISSVGMYLNIGRIGINPSMFAIFSGGAGTSFTFFGFYLPIIYQF